MAKTTRTQDELELALLEMALKERSVSLLRQAVLVLITLALAITTIICAPRGSSWPVPTGIGGFGAATASFASLSVKY